MKKYVCTVCGYIAEGEIPAQCPVCTPSSPADTTTDGVMWNVHATAAVSTGRGTIRTGSDSWARNGPASRHADSF